jgi:small-conductance mechanosensitive channel
VDTALWAIAIAAGVAFGIALAPFAAKFVAWTMGGASSGLTQLKAARKHIARTALLTGVLGAVAIAAALLIRAEVERREDARWRAWRDSVDALPASPASSSAARRPTLEEWIRDSAMRTVPPK